MLAGNIGKQSGQNLNRFGASLITTRRLVADEIQACHATAQAQVLNVDQAGTLPSVGAATPAQCGQAGVAAPPPGTTCFTSLATALGRVNNQLGGTVISLAEGTYTLPDVDLPVKDLKFIGDTCPVVGVAYIHGARRNTVASNFIPDNLLTIQGSGVTTLSINNQTITVSMDAGDPDFSGCELVGHSVKIHVTGGVGVGSVTTHTITAATANSITISGIMPLGPLNNGDGFVIMPNVILSAADGTQVKSMQHLELEGVSLQATGTLYIHADEQAYLNSVIDTDSTLFVGGKGILGTGNSVFGHLVGAHGTQQLWTWGAILGEEATVLADASSFTWQFGVAAGGVLPFHAQNGAQASVFGTDFFFNIDGSLTSSGSSLNFANSWADANTNGHSVDMNSSVSAEAIPSIVGFGVIPASVTNNGTGIAATYGSYIWNAGTGSLPIAALDLPAVGGNGDDFSLDGIAGNFPVAPNGHLWGDTAPAASGSGFSHIYGLA
jgi:hypothetical protein